MTDAARKAAMNRDERTALSRIRAMEKECFALAANQCHDGYCDDYGNHRCREVDALRAQLQTALKVVEVSRALITRNDFWDNVDHAIPGELDDVIDALAAFDILQRAMPQLERMAKSR